MPATDAADLLFALGYSDPDGPDGLLNSYLEHVANGGLRRYQAILQTGAKAGEPLYVHCLTGVLTAERLRPLLGLSDVEARVLYSAFSVHDLNKVAPGAAGRPRAFNGLAEPGRVRTELEGVGVPGFFPQYLDYLEDITLLVRQHSAHYSVGAELLVVSRHPYRLPRERLTDLLVPLMRALDLLGLSSTLEEAEHKQAFLDQVHRTTPRRYTWVRHRVSEQRGLLTNVLHNAAVDFLSARFDLVPLAFYPEGVAYLADALRPPTPGPADRAALGTTVVQALAGKSRQDFRKFIRSGPSGIVVGPECLQVGVGFPEIFGAIYNLVAGRLASRRFDSEALEVKVRAALQAGLERPDLAAMVEAHLRQASVVPPTQEGMAAGDLLRAYYIFLMDHLRERVGQPWPHLYGLLGLSPLSTQVFDLVDARYQRAYVVAHARALELDALYACLLADGTALFEGATAAEVEDGSGDDPAAAGDFGAMADYAAAVLHLDFGPSAAPNFGAALRTYVAQNHRQCCHCGSEFPTGKWMAGQVPPNVGVQSYSNRLPGGSAAEPKRNVCSVCRVQFTLEKLAHHSLKASHTTFLFLFPYTYHPAAFLQAMRAEIGHLVAQDISVLFPQTDAAINDFIEARPVDIRVRLRGPQGRPYQNGIVLPHFPETIGNVLVFPLNCPGDGTAERFLFGLQTAMLLQRRFSCRAALCPTPVPTVGRAEFADLFVDGVPLGFHGLVPEPDLDGGALGRLWLDVSLLHRLRRLLYNPERQEDVLLALVRSLDSAARLGVFFAADRLLEHWASRGQPSSAQVAGRALYRSREVLPLLRELVRGDDGMQPLQRLAEMAWEGHIIGRSLERNALLKPFDLILDALEDRSPAFGDDTLQAQLVEEVFRHIEAIAPEEYRPGRTKREKVKAFVAQFFAGVLGDVYGGSTPRLLADKRNLRSAYLFYLREQIPVKSAAVGSE